MNPAVVKRRGPGRPPLEESAQHRESLLDVAATVFVEDGFASASTNEIARRAGASKATLYRLFPSKADLFVAVMKRRMSGQFAELDQFIERHREDPIGLLHRLAVDMLTSAAAREQSQLRRVVLHEGNRFPELAKALWTETVGRFIARLSRYFASPQAQTALNIADGEEAADVFLTLVIGLALLQPELTSPRGDAWIRKRARQRVEAFLKIYGRTRAPRPRPR